MSLSVPDQSAPDYTQQTRKDSLQQKVSRGRGIPVLRGVFFQLEVVPLLVPTALSECLPVLLTRAVAEAAFCSLGDWLNVCRTPRGVVAEPRDSWLEAYRHKGSQAYHGQRWQGCLEWPLLVRLTSSHPLGSLESKVKRP